MRWNKLRSFRGILFLFLVTITTSNPVKAQEPVCPPGFEWKRMSGVGCVQANCGEIVNAKLSYTSSCICQDGYKSCSQPVNYEGFDPSLCGINCPYSELISCVSVEDTCPNEEPSPDLTTEPESNIPPAEQSPSNNESSIPNQDNAYDEDGFSDLMEIFEEFVTGGHTAPASSWQEAAGGMTATALLAAWVLVNLLSGGNINEIPSGQSGTQSGVPQGSRNQAQASSLLNLSGTGQSAGQSSAGPPAGPTTSAQTPGQKSPSQSAGPPGGAQQAAAPLITDPARFHQAITDKFHEILKEKVDGGYYVRNPGFFSKIWNNFPITSSVIESVRGLTGGQCGEMADWGHGWIKPWAEQTFGPGVIVDSIWIGESSSRRPEGFAGAADALFQANHTANRITLPNGDSYVVDFWDGMIKQRDGSPEKIKDIKVVTESEWINKWRDQIETASDPAEICNLNRYQESLRQKISSFDARHPSLAAAQSPEMFQENNEVVERAIQDWVNTSNYPPEIKQTVIENWRRNGGGWETYRTDPPLDPASSVIDAYYQVTE